MGLVSQLHGLWWADSLRTSGCRLGAPHEQGNPSYRLPSNVTIRHLKYMRAKIRKDYRLKTHCKHGHEYTEENTCYAANGTGRNRKRQCRICRNSAQRKRRAPANPGRRTNQHTKVKLAIQTLWDRLLRHPDHTYKIKMLEAKREYDEWLERTKSQRRGKTICVGAGKPGKKAA